MTPRIFIAGDHTGFILKTTLAEYVRTVLNLEIEDMGAHELVQTDDYPDFVMPCATRVATEPNSLGIIIGGSGQGEAMCANRVKGVRAALFYGQAQAMGPIDALGAPALDGYDIVRLAREHNNANVLSVAARFVSVEDAKEAVRIFLTTEFSQDERHVRRLAKF